LKRLLSLFIRSASICDRNTVIDSKPLCAVFGSTGRTIDSDTGADSEERVMLDKISLRRER
jgi:hypothetical protein